MATPNLIASIFHTRPPAAHKRQIGIEVERIGLYRGGQSLLYRNVTNGGKSNRFGAGEILKKLSETYDWIAKTNAEGQILGLTCCAGSVTLEPGSQMELSSVVRPDLNSLAELVDGFEADVDKVTQPLGLSWVSLGVNPFARVSEIDVIPSARYHAMTDYLGQRDILGTSMMRLSASVQVNLDYESEEEAIEMLRTALLLAPLSYALFAASPFYEGQKTDFLSFRGHIWKHTDPDRCGLFEAAFASDFNFESYAQFLWKMPLMFALNEQGDFVPAFGKSLSEIDKGALPGISADAANQRYAVQQLFTEARLKPGYIEVRSIDGLPRQLRYAAAAFWMGILYSPTARQRVQQIFGGWVGPALRDLLTASQRHGLSTKVQKSTLQDYAKELLDLSRETLKDRNLGEALFLEPLVPIVSSGKNIAQRLLSDTKLGEHSQWLAGLLGDEVYDFGREIDPA